MLRLWAEVSNELRNSKQRIRRSKEWFLTEKTLKKQIIPPITRMV